MKLHIVPGGPPSLAAKLTLKHLNLPHEIVVVDYINGEHLTDEYAKKNPQREIPVLDDDGFFLSESNAIMQYICDKYKPDSDLYPRDPKIRAIVNHRLCFNLGTYYRYICEHIMDPIFYLYEQTPIGLKKTVLALETFNALLAALGKKYVAADHITIADFPLIGATMTLEAAEFDFSKYRNIVKWYNTFKKEHPELWKMVEADMQMLVHFIKNPVDMSKYKHPIHVARHTKQK